MTERYGYDSQLLIAKESIWGDGTTPSVSQPILSDTFVPQKELKNRSPELSSSRFEATPRPGRKWSQGGFVMNVYPDLVGYWLLAMYGSPSVSQVDSGVYDNTFEPGIAIDKSLSLEYSKGGGNPFDCAGYKVNMLNWSQEKEGDAQMLRLTVDGGGKFGVEGSRSAFTAPTLYPFQFDESVITYDSSTIYPESVSWSDNNGLVIPNHRISGGADTREPIIGGRYTANGSFVVDQEDFSYFDDYKDQTDIAIVNTYTTTQIISGAYVYTLTVTMPKIRVTGSPVVQVSGPGGLKLTVPITLYAGTVGESTVPISIKLRCATDFSAV